MFVASNAGTLLTSAVANSRMRLRVVFRVSEQSIQSSAIGFSVRVHSVGFTCASGQVVAWMLFDFLCITFAHFW